MSASTKLCRICKIIDAAISLMVRALRRSLQSSSRDTSNQDPRKWLYIGSCAAYIHLHIIHRRDHVGLARPQSRTSQASRWLKPPPRTRSRSLVSKQRFLRRARSGASQIRDAAPGTRRGRREERGGCPVRCVASDFLPGGSRLCTSGLERLVTQGARAQRCAQAHRRSHALHRRQADRRTSTRRPSVGRTDQDRTRCLRPPPQHRTRFGAEKKTVITASCVPAAAVSVYETLRAEVLGGQGRPEGLGAVVYHGMLDGLAVLMSAAAPHVICHPPTTAIPSIRDDRALLRLMANMILQTQSEVKHVY
jgi:hypothetical protein